MRVYTQGCITQAHTHPFFCQAATIFLLTSVPRECNVEGWGRQCSPNIPQAFLHFLHYSTVTLDRVTTSELVVGAEVTCVTFRIRQLGASVSSVFLSPQKKPWSFWGFSYMVEVGCLAHTGSCGGEEATFTLLRQWGSRACLLWQEVFLTLTNKDCLVILVKSTLTVKYIILVFLSKTYQKSSIPLIIPSSTIFRIMSLKIFTL